MWSPQALLRSRRETGFGLIHCLVLSALLPIVAAPAAAEKRPQRVFLLEGLRATQPAGLRTLEAFRNRLKERGGSDIEVFIDFLELSRFPGEDHEERTARYLSEKYSEKRPDLLVPISRGALHFVMKYRDVLGPGLPVVYCCTAASAATAMSLPRDVVGVVTDYDWSKTLDLADRLQPEARNLAIISGASAYDREWLDDLLREIEPRSKRYALRHLNGLPYEEMLTEVARLPRDTIVLLTPVFADGSGQPRLPPDVAADVTKASAAPAYAPIDTLFGTGIVGGYMDSFEAQGVATADLALRVLQGQSPETIPAQTRPQHTNRIDARQLERWGLSKNALPPNADVRFKPPTLWEEHRNAVLGAIVAFGLQTAGIVLLLVQVRRRKQAELSLRESEERLALAAADANVGIWRLDLVTKDLWATDHCRAMLDITGAAKITARELLDKVNPEDRDGLAGSLDMVAKFGSPLNAEFRIAPTSGNPRWLVARGHPIAEGGGKPHHISGIFADITDLKAAEAEAETQRKEVSHLMRVSVLGELSGAIAHELNQPLTAILAYAQAARRLLGGKEPDLGRIAGVLDEIVREDDRASEVIRRLHGLLRKGESKLEPVDLNDLVKSTLRLLNSELISRTIRMNVALGNSLPSPTGDPVQLQQVLLNLLVNAMDAMNTTPVHERLLSVTTRASGNDVEVRIADRGHGVAETERAKLFIPFFTTKDRGLGLGLSICSKIVKAHAGKLKIDNNADGGATASLTLPADIAAALAS
jgi:PAS domain S-box-containing protein